MSTNAQHTKERTAHQDWLLSLATGAAIRRHLHGEEEAAVAWSRPEDGMERVTEKAALVVGLPGTSTWATAEKMG